MRQFIIRNIERVVDGDTVDCLLDLGFHIYTCKRVRLMGIDTPECRTTDPVEKQYGMLAKQALAERCSNGTRFELRCSNSVDKFGRVLGELWVDDVNINRWLCDNAYAVDYDGKSRDELMHAL